MRIWSIHPKYLDSKGLVALWRESLLAKNVLEGNTRGYKNHPQLDRFKDSGKAVESINYYLSEVFNDSLRRGYKFNKNKFEHKITPNLLTVTEGQMKYEINHLLKKLKVRDPSLNIKLSVEIKFDPHPLFRVVKGEIENWEIIKL